MGLKSLTPTLSRLREREGPAKREGEGPKLLLLIALLCLPACTRENPRADAVPVYDLKINGRSTGAAIVEEGDTLGGIANRYGLTINDIIRTNMLGQGGDLVRPNQRLVLPPPREYTVKAGDSFDRIARMFDLSEQDLAAANNLHPPYALTAGQTLKITAPKIKTQRPRPPAENLAPQPVDIVDAEPLTAKPSPAKKAGTARDFSRPVEGEVISGFGPKSGGLYNDGINIKAKAGTPVGAAKSGTVVFAGEGPDGYGNMVLVKHDDGYFTVYSHLSQVKVREGASLGKGGIVGRVGATGKVKEPQLHFEIRKGTDPIDPESQF